MGGTEGRMGGTNDKRGGEVNKDKYTNLDMVSYNKHITNKIRKTILGTQPSYTVIHRPGNREIHLRCGMAVSLNIGTRD